MCAKGTAHFLTSPKIPDAKGIFVMIQFTPVGDSGVLAVCGSEISEQVNAQVMALDAAVQAAQLPGVVETVPTYAALLVTLDPLQTDADTLIPALRRLWDALPPVSSTAAGRLVEVPVCYGGDYGPDLAFVAQHAGLTEQQVIDIHCGRDYRIFMLGFLPGFPYLGGMDERIVCPRLQTPRTKIPAGAVGIGGKQTGIYPLASPGGWQLIGRTPLRLFDPAGGGKLPYAAGDRIRFVPISPESLKPSRKNRGRHCELACDKPRPADHRAGCRPHRLCRAGVPHLWSGGWLRYADRQPAGGQPPGSRCRRAGNDPAGRQVSV